MSATPRTVVALVLAGAVVTIGQLTRPTEMPAASAKSRTPTATAVVCPDLAGEGSTTMRAAGAGEGSLQLAGLSGPARAVPTATEPPSSTDLPGVAGPIVVRAEGMTVDGLAVDQVTRETGGAVRGLSAVRCAPAGVSSWFVGGATTTGNSGELILLNPEPLPATVEVDVWTAAGPADPRAGRGLTVAPGQRLSVPLDRLAVDSDLLALHVRAVRGRVAAAVRSVRRDGDVPQGVDNVPQAQPPARRVVVAGLPSGPGRRTVLVTNPTQDDTTVTLTLLTGDGEVPVGEIDVPAGTSVAREVSEQLAGTPAAAVVTSPGAPVLAAGFVYDLQDGPVRELAYAGSAQPLTGPAPLPLVPLDDRTGADLLVSALDGDVVLDVVSAQGMTRLTVPAGTTSTAALTGPVLLRPIQGAPVAAMSLRERGLGGPLTAALTAGPGAGEPSGGRGSAAGPRVVRPDPLAGTG